MTTGSSGKHATYELPTALVEGPEFGQTPADATEVDLLRAALKPFAGLLDRWNGDADTPPIRPGQTTIEMGIKISDMQRAKAAYERNQ